MNFSKKSLALFLCMQAMLFLPFSMNVSTSLFADPFFSSVFDPDFSEADAAIEPKIIELTELTQEQLFDDFLDNEDTSIIIKCSEGTILSITYDVDCPYFSVGDEKGNDNTLSFRVNKTFYLQQQWTEEVTYTYEENQTTKHTESNLGLYFSEDLINWKTPTEFFGFYLSAKSVQFGPNSLHFTIVKEALEE